MTQISPMADGELHALSRLIGESDELLAKVTELKNDRWDRVFELMAEFDKPYFIANDGYTLSRQRRQGAPKLDEDLLYHLLMGKFTKAQVRKIWDAITEPKVSSVKLEAAVQNGVIPPEIIAKCITEPEPTYARVRREWSKQDHERARIFGIERRGPVEILDEQLSDA